MNTGKNATIVTPAAIAVVVLLVFFLAASLISQSFWVKLSMNLFK